MGSSGDRLVADGLWRQVVRPADDGVMSEPVIDTRARRLVFGDDGSACADVAWLWLVEHRWDGWSVDVVTALDPPLGPPPSAEERTPHEWQPPQPRRSTPGAGVGPVRHLVATGDARVVLLAPADLTVIGGQGRGMLASMRLGSTAEWLVHDPSSPLVVARHGRRTERVLVGSDGSAHAAVAIAALASLPWLEGVAIRVLVVDDGTVDRAAAVGAAQALDGRGADVTVVERRGRPTPTVLDEIDAWAPDLVVLGTRGLSGWQRLRLGSTTNAVLRATDCSVLVANAD